MGKNLSVFSAVEHQRTFTLTEPDVLDFSDEEVVISGRMYIYSAQNNLR